MNLAGIAYAPGTASNLKSHWKKYIGICIRHRLQIFPPVQDNIIRFYTSMVNNLKAYSSLLNFESSINLFYSIYGFDMDNSSILTKLLNLGAKKELSTVPATKLPLEVDHVKQFINICDPGNPFEVTFCAAIQVGFMALQ